MMPTLLAYIGPETIMPLTSILAAIGGVFMLFGRTLLGWCKRAFGGRTGWHDTSAGDLDESQN